ncbi:MAG TPA: hypothetical protein V6D11_20470 [Waterburya sp.]
MATKKPKVSIYLTDEQKAALEDWARREKRSISNLISVLVDEALSRQKQKDSAQKAE